MADELVSVKHVDLNTDRLILGKLELSQIPDIYKIFQMPEVNKYFGNKFPESLKEEVLFLTKSTFEVNEPTRILVWSIADKNKNTFFGTIRMQVINQFNPFRGSISYWLDDKFWGQGYMSEALNAVVKFAFMSDLKLDSLEIKVFSPNTTSQNVAQKCGFVLDGIIRRSAIKDGDFVDTHIYTLLKSEYKQ
jgi:ribosomal-protein-alanine N-acetyltransferase